MKVTPAHSRGNDTGHSRDLFHRFFGGLGRFSVRFRWPIVIFWLLATVAASAAFPSIASVIKTNNTSFLPSSVPSEQAARLASPLQKSNLTPVTVVALTSNASLSTADQTALTTLSAALSKVHTVTSVRNQGISSSGQAAQYTVLSNVSQANNNDDTNLIHNLRSTIAAQHLPSDMQVHLAGALASEVDSAGQNNGNSVDLISVLFILVLLFLIFRAFLAPFITVLPSFLVVGLAGPVIAELTKVGLQVSVLTQLMLIVLVLGAGTDYGLFLVFRTREEIRGGREPKDAVAHALERVGESITFSAGTVIAALLSLLAATFGIYQSLGAPLAIGIGVMLLAGLTLQPALLAIFGKAVFWPSKVRKGDMRSSLWGRVSARIVGSPAKTLIIGLIVFGVLAAFSAANKPAGFGNSLSAPAGTDAAKGNAILSKYYPPSSSNPTGIVFKMSRPVWDDPQVMAQAQTLLASHIKVFKSVNGPLDTNGVTLSPAQFTELYKTFGPPSTLLAAASSGDTKAAIGQVASKLPPGISIKQLEAYVVDGNSVSANGRVWQLSTSLVAGDPSTTNALQAVPSIRKAAKEVAMSIGAVDRGVTGEAPGIYDVNHVSNSDLLTVIPLAIVVIAVLLALVMRSLVAPLYLIASVAISYLAALGLAVLLFIKLFGDGGLTFILPFLMFLFLLALGEDYNILVMTRIREEARNLPLREAVRRAVTATGGTVTSAGLVLAGTFAVFAVVGGRGSGGSQIRDVGAGIALGVLMDTFLVRTLLVPSTVALIGRFNWWPSALSKRPAEEAQVATSELADVPE